MSRFYLYSQNRHTLIIDGIPIDGFADGDYIQIKEDGNAATRSFGGDGPSMSIATDQGGNLTLGLYPNSPVIGALYTMRKQQKENPRLFNIILLSGVDELINFNGCAFGDQPQLGSGGPTMQPRQFSFECLKIVMDESGTIVFA